MNCISHFVRFLWGQAKIYLPALILQRSATVAPSMPPLSWPCMSFLRKTAGKPSQPGNSYTAADVRWSRKIFLAEPVVDQSDEVCDGRLGVILAMHYSVGR